MFKYQAIIFLPLLWALPSTVLSQEITIFKVSDFDLHGKVKSCVVSTDYGKEAYQFDEYGRLIEAATHFNDQDYDITIYKFGNYKLLEKRVESYRGKVLDKATSIANFYTYDSTQNYSVVEKIITYEKEFLEQYEYTYTADNKLSKIVRSNNDGIDETSVVYYNEDDSSNANYILNRELKQSVKTKINTINDSTQTKVVTTKRFQEGIPNTATEEVFDGNEKLMSISQLRYDVDLEKFKTEKVVLNTYDANGAMMTTETRVGPQVSLKEFIYQYDLADNWIKQIVTPDNRYKTRKITYYETANSEKSKE